MLIIERDETRLTYMSKLIYYITLYHEVKIKGYNISF